MEVIIKKGEKISFWKLGKIGWEDSGLRAGENIFVLKREGKRMFWNSRNEIVVDIFPLI